MIHRLTPLFLAGWLLMSSSPAQPGLVTFDDVRKRVRTLLSRQSSPSITELEGTLRELQTLYRAPAEEREKICRWLYGTLLKKGGTHDAKLRMRLIALQTVAVLADEPEWADKLIELALRSGRASLKGVHFWVERALGELRGRGHVLRLMAHAVGKDVRARRIALGGLGRRVSGEFQELLHPMIEDLTAMAGGSDVELQIRALAVLGRIARDRRRATQLSFIALTRSDTDSGSVSLTSMRWVRRAVASWARSLRPISEGVPETPKVSSRSSLMSFVIPAQSPCFDLR